jgi:hypothetical protein
VATATTTANPSTTKSSIPQVGWRVRVFYDKCDDLFGTDRPQAAGWHFGTATNVTDDEHNNSTSTTTTIKSNKYKLAVTFDDYSMEEVEYYEGHPTVQRLMEELGEEVEDDNRVVLVAGTNEVAYETGGFELEVGDLVQGNYQKKGQWFRGRVAAVVSSSTPTSSTGTVPPRRQRSSRTRTSSPETRARQFCDIFYDDGEYESRITFERGGAVRKIQSGRDHPEWLLGLTFAGRTKITSANTTCTAGAGAQDEIRLSNGKTLDDYSSVVAKMVKNVRPDKKLAWPTTTTSTTTPSPGKRKSVPDGTGSSHITKAAPLVGGGPFSAVNTEIVKKQPPSSAPKSSNKANNKEPLWRPRPMGGHVVARHHSSSLAALPQPPQPSSSEETNDAKQLLQKVRPTNARHGSMHATMANTFWKALNSYAPHLGSTTFTLLTTVHHQLPNDPLCKQLVELITHGPKAQQEFFSDHNRMTCAVEYVQLLLSLDDDDSQQLPQKEFSAAYKLAQAAGPVYWKDCLEQLSTCVYCAPKDETRNTVAALKRIGQSLFVNVCAAQLFQDLMQRLLQPFFISNSGQGDMSSSSTADEYRSLPIIRDILKHGTGPAMKLAITTLVGIWFRHGHYLWSEDGVPADASSDLRQLVCGEIRQLVRNLGKLVSYLIWLWSKDQGQPMEDSAFSFRDSIDGHVREYAEQQKENNMPALDAPKMKLNLILSLCPVLAAKLRPRLADLLGVKSKFASIVS